MEGASAHDPVRGVICREIPAEQSIDDLLDIDGIDAELSAVDHGRPSPLSEYSCGSRIGTQVTVKELAQAWSIRLLNACCSK
jgi:hypothetical protein